MFGLKTPDKADLTTAGVDPEPADTQAIAADDDAGDETNSASEPGDAEQADNDEEEPTGPAILPLEIAGNFSELITPEIKSVKVLHNGTLTTIEAVIFMAEGWVEKRIVLPVRLMAHEIATHIANVESW